MPHNPLRQRLARIRTQLVLTTPANERRITLDVLEAIHNDTLTDAQRADPWVQEQIAIHHEAQEYLAAWHAEHPFVDDLGPH